MLSPDHASRHHRQDAIRAASVIPRRSNSTLMRLRVIRADGCASQY